MNTEMQRMGKVHPMVIFWLGVLTGAMIIGLIFLYKVLVPAGDGSASLMLTSPSRVEKTDKSIKMGSPMPDPPAKNLNKNTK